MKLSVVVPVYNVEATVMRCLDSLLCQNVPDMEIIMVDDGSTDGSAALCKSFAAAHDNARLLRQENRGLGAARNSGIAEAQGEWLYFIDSDDELAPDTLSLVLNEAERRHADIAEFPILRVREGSVETDKQQLPEAIGMPNDYKPLDYWLSSMAWRHTYAWNKLYRRELFATVRWAEGVRYEDAFTLPLLLNVARRVSIVSQGLYYYYKNEQGLAHTATREHNEQLLTAQWRVLNRLLNDYGKPFCKDNKKTLAVCYADIVNIQLTVLKQGGTKPILPILPYWHTPKLKLLHLIGFKNLARLCSFLS